MPNVMQATYFGSHLVIIDIIWHFEMLMKCNANISIPGAMQNVNEMQMKCKCNANEM